jgi:hypothetical protein
LRFVSEPQTPACNTLPTFPYFDPLIIGYK